MKYIKSIIAYKNLKQIIIFYGYNNKFKKIFRNKNILKIQLSEIAIEYLAGKTLKQSLMFKIILLYQKKNKKNKK